MLAIFVYGVIIGTLLIGLAILLFKAWDKGQSRDATNLYSATEWLMPARAELPAADGLSEQALYDASETFINILKGVFAGPTPAKLARLNELLAAPHNLHDQYWHDLNVRLVNAYNDYRLEYLALIELLAEKAEDPVQLYAGLRLAGALPAAPAKIRELVDTLKTAPAVKPALRAARALRG